MATIESRYVKQLRHGWDAKLLLQDTSISFKESVKTIYYHANLQHNEWACKLQEVLLVLGSTRRREKIQDLRGDRQRMESNGAAKAATEVEEEEEEGAAEKQRLVPVSLKDERNFLEGKVEHWEQIKSRCNVLLVEIDEHVGGYTDEFMRTMALITDEVKAAPWAGNHDQDPWNHLPTFGQPHLLEMAREVPPVTIDATRFGVVERHSWAPVSRSKLPYRNRATGVKMTCSALSTMDAPYMNASSELFVGTGCGAVLAISMDTLAFNAAIPGATPSESPSFAVPGASLPPANAAAGRVLSHTEDSALCLEESTVQTEGDVISGAGSLRSASIQSPSRKGPQSTATLVAAAAALQSSATTSTVEDVSKALRIRLNTECNDVRQFDGPIPSPLSQPHEIIVMPPAAQPPVEKDQTTVSKDDGAASTTKGSLSEKGSRQVTPSAAKTRTSIVTAPVVPPTPAPAAARPSSAAHRLVTSIPGVRILKNHVYPVSGINLIKYSEEKWILATTSVDKTVRISSADTGNLMCILHATAAMITAVEVHPELRYLVTTALDGTVAAWDAYTGDRIGILAKLKVGITALHICPRIQEPTSPAASPTTKDSGSGTFGPKSPAPEGSSIHNSTSASPAAPSSEPEWTMFVGCKNGHIYELNTPTTYQVGAKTKIAGNCSSASCYLPHGALPFYPPPREENASSVGEVAGGSEPPAGSPQTVVYGGHRTNSHITCLHTVAGFLVSGDHRGQVVHWDTVHQQEVRAMAGGHVDSITAIQVSLDGFLFTSSRDGLVLVRNLNDGALLSRLNSHFGPVTGLMLTLVPTDPATLDNVDPLPAPVTPSGGRKASSASPKRLSRVAAPSGGERKQQGASPSVVTMGSFALGKVPEGYEAVLVSVSEDESILAWTLKYDVE